MRGTVCRSFAPQAPTGHVPRRQPAQLRFPSGSRAASWSGSVPRKSASRHTRRAPGMAPGRAAIIEHRCAGLSWAKMADNLAGTAPAPAATGRVRAPTKSTASRNRRPRGPPVARRSRRTPPPARPGVSGAPPGARGAPRPRIQAGHSRTRHGSSAHEPFVDRAAYPFEAVQNGRRHRQVANLLRQVASRTVAKRIWRFMF